MTKFTYPERLIFAAKQGQIVPFVGAGVSKKSLPNHFPNWKELASDLASLAYDTKSISKQEFSEIGGLIKSNRLTFAVDILKKSLPREEYESYLIEKFEYIDHKNINLTTQNLLLKISGKVIITTNYDRLIEDAFAKSFKRSPTTATFEQSASVQYSIQDHRNSGDPIIFKIHGDIASKNSIILSERDYRALLYDHQAYDAVITSMFLNNVFLFVGFSLDDREVLFHLERLRHKFSYVSQAHYALLPKNSFSNIEIRQFRESYGVEVITFDKEGGYKEIDTFVRGILRKVNSK